MVNLSEIALFILATTVKNSKYDQPYPTYYESRITPIATTWASHFPHTYFVFGTNTFDHEFLVTHCHHRESIPETLSDSNSRDSRFLRASSPQMPAKNQFDVFECPVASNATSKAANNLKTGTNASLSGNLSSLAGATTFFALYVGNCTGEYFGSGPTCRCQESMRWFLQDSRFQTKKWFMFIDDDIYIRPLIFSQFVEHLERNKTVTSNPVAFVSATRSAGVKNIRLRQSNGSYIPLPNECRNLWQGSMFYAQPALLNRLAMFRLRPMIENQGLIALQQVWGSSHDAVLGIALWVHGISMFSFASSYCGGIITTEQLIPSKHLTARQVKWRSGLLQCMIFHRVMNFRFANRQSTSKNRHIVWKQYVSQYDIARFLEEFHDQETPPLSADDIVTKVLLPLGPSTIGLTPFLEEFPKFPVEYENFIPRYCARANVNDNHL